MKERKILKHIPFILIFLAVIAAEIAVDQISKAVMGNLLAGNKTINVLGEWLTFSWTLNDGAAFGGFKGANILFFVMTVLGLPVFLYMLWRSRTRSVWGQIGFAFIAGGAVGNAIDRMIIQPEGEFFGGKVRDFIYVKGFAIFNIADSFLVVGVIMAILAIMFFDYDAVFKKNPEMSVGKQISEIEAKMEEDADTFQETDNIMKNGEKTETLDSKNKGTGFKEEDGGTDDSIRS